VRSNIYDSLHFCLQGLKGFSFSENLILKSKESGKFQTFVESHKQSEDLAGTIYLQFLQLRKDFTSNQVNLAKYKDGLKTFKTFFEENKDISYPALHKDEIVKELGKYF
jgi:hypothetical protein